MTLNLDDKLLEEHKFEKVNNIWYYKQWLNYDDDYTVNIKYDIDSKELKIYVIDEWSGNEYKYHELLNIHPHNNHAWHVKAEVNSLVVSLLGEGVLLKGDSN